MNELFFHHQNNNNNNLNISVCKTDYNDSHNI